MRFGPTKSQWSALDWQVAMQLSISQGMVLLSSSTKQKGDSVDVWDRLLTASQDNRSTIANMLE
jgi:hypothetical protein